MPERRAQFCQTIVSPKSDTDPVALRSMAPGLLRNRRQSATIKICCYITNDSDFRDGNVTIPQKCVGVATDNNVNIWNLFGNLHVFEVACVTNRDQDVDPLLFQPFGLFADALDFVEDSNSIRAGNVL